ncbi:hypothetical protein FJR48_09710 [Sulfurimonas lithotrophica]|uniref:MotA/TolQ/ExbB proton channel domain-containing protein n=1 Tax=Sulfurimonas lithotrophica TaxID=2590022 RepID=A0A5P8P2T7_9BACT|nr:MotA/TolQ/ExbB proton channel family protein [Sulfurimonas lithotrophica]QFR49984.1 hypothetical protein FJR48_09710 [Sulfurimonas lithotrophica]
MIDSIMYTLSQLFLTPTLLLILLMFVYSFIAFGGFIYEAISRKRNHMHLYTKGFYPVINYFKTNNNTSIDDLELFAYKRLENTRNVSRIAPMMGLIATLIPLGPALKALTDGNIQGMSEGLIIAFSGVTLGLIAASMAFWIGNVRKRWYADEILYIDSQKAT